MYDVDTFLFVRLPCQVMEEAFILTLADILGECCTEEVTKAWRELFGFMAGTMLRGLGQETQKCGT